MKNLFRLVLFLSFYSSFSHAQTACGPGPVTVSKSYCKCYDNVDNSPYGTDSSYSTLYLVALMSDATMNQQKVETRYGRQGDQTPADWCQQAITTNPICL